MKRHIHRSNKIIQDATKVRSKKEKTKTIIIPNSYKIPKSSPPPPPA